MLNIVLGNQLFPSWERLSAGDEFLMIESHFLCARYRYHQQKLVLIFACMRQFAENLRKKGFKVHYVTLDASEGSRDYFEILSDELRSRNVREIRVAEIADRGFARAFESWAKREKIRIEPAESQLFLTPTHLYSEAFGSRRPFMKTFYEWQRRRLRVLLDSNGDPQGGQWSFDTDNRKKLPRGYHAPAFPMATRSKIVKEIIALIEREFPQNPGRAADFWLPTTTTESVEWLDQFLSWRLDQFGPYEDALRAGEDPNEDILNHSALSPMMNVGILPAELVVERTLAHARRKRTPIASVEGFIRQIIGWREFVKGIDGIYGERQATTNFFKHRRRMKPCWYDGTTGLPPVDDAIRKAIRRGYNHHIERLMVLSNVMLLSELNPVEVHCWFMEMYVDSSEWVMGPNVYGMGQFSDGGIFATKPYICGSNTTF